MSVIGSFYAARKWFTNNILQVHYNKQNSFTQKLFIFMLATVSFSKLWSIVEQGP